MSLFGYLENFVKFRSWSIKHERIPWQFPQIRAWNLNNWFGSSVILFSQTGTYIGDWKNGLQHGKGSAVYLNGNQYGGEFKHGLKNGYGEFIVINGDRYYNDRLHGQHFVILSRLSLGSGITWGGKTKYCHDSVGRMPLAYFLILHRIHQGVSNYTELN